MSDTQTVMEPTVEVIKAPTDDAGRPFDYELIYEGGNSRAYAHDVSDLITHIIPGYDGFSIEEQWQARLHRAIDAQVAVQAYLNNAYPFHECPPDARRVLNGSRFEQPSVTSWDHPVPLVLVAHAYTPAGLLAPPTPVDGRDPNVLWIDPSDEESLMRTLDALGAIMINVRGGDDGALS